MRPAIQNCNSGYNTAFTTPQYYTQLYILCQYKNTKKLTEIFRCTFGCHCAQQFSRYGFGVMPVAVLNAEVKALALRKPHCAAIHTFKCLVLLYIPNNKKNSRCASKLLAAFFHLTSAQKADKIISLQTNDITNKKTYKRRIYYDEQRNCTKNYTF